MADVPDLFKTAPREVIRYFEAKRSVPTFDWRDMAPAEHAFSHTVAKTIGYDVLGDIRTAMKDVVDNRIPYEKFQNQLTPVLQAKGWWGKQQVVDPKTGIIKTVQLGSPRRLRTIYWANTATAHAAGEWERSERNKAFLPFLLYTLSEAERKRPEHLGWVGIVLPVDHPFWNTHYPPNGWGCKCRVRQISRREAESLGWVDGQDGPAIIRDPWFNKRTNQTHQVPRGIDPGWDTNPGKLRAQNVSQFLHNKLSAMPPYRQGLAITDIVNSPILKAMANGNMPGSFLPVAQIPIHAVEAMGAKTQILRLSSDSVRHILHDYADRNLSISDLKNALSIVSVPQALVRLDSKNAIAILGEHEGRWWRTVVKSTANGTEWWLTSFHKMRKNRAEAFIQQAQTAGKLIVGD